MYNVNYSPPLLQHVVANQLIATEHFVLVDVGCAMGIDPVWRLFGDYLRSYAFDPQADEIARLQAIEPNPGVRYFARFIGLPADHPYVQAARADPTSTSDYYHPFPRSSAVAGLAQKMAATTPDDEPGRTSWETWFTRKLVVDKISIDEFVQQESIDHVDFIKIDTDGSDFEALLSSESAIEKCDVLGFMIETPVYGSYTHTANSFHNIDRFMKKHGFMLYAMNQNRYSRAALPAQFVWHAPYETVSGPPMLGDSIYLRDGAAADYLRIWNTDLSPIKILKLACLYDLFRVPDCAAELICARREAVAQLCDPDVLLDVLTPWFRGKKLSYDEYVSLFHRSYKHFFPTPPKPAAEAGGEPTDGANRELESTRAALEKQQTRSRQLAIEGLRRRALNRALLRKLEGLRSEHARLQAEHETTLQAMQQMRSTRLWRWGSACWRANNRIKRALGLVS